jgi:uncharacterized protein (DUF885 family)
VTGLSAIFEFADRYVADDAAFDPFSATYNGIAGYDHLLTDFSPAGYDQRAQRLRDALDQLAALEPANDDDRRAAEFITERFHAALLEHDAGAWQRELNAIAAPPSEIRAIFDLMPRTGEAAWEHIAARVEGVPTALDGLRATYELGRRRHPAALRQVLAVAEQCSTWAADRWFDTLTAEAEAVGGGTLPPTLRQRLRAAAAAANGAYGTFATWLRDDYAPVADPTDGCGPDRYRVGVRQMLGADLDPTEMYEWAWGDFHRLRSEIAATCARILPGAGFAEVIHLLETDPQRAVHGADAYQAWLQEITDEALHRAHAHFEIPAVMDRCEARIPPAGSAAAPYYTSPSEDFSRPGRTWYPTLGRHMFPMWSDVTTCYHESVPGHHLQLGYAKVQASSLSRIQRNSFISGHGEGWALYAEQLCDEFGWFDNPDHRLGYLSGQMLRAVRVIVDIGMHLGMRVPPGTALNDGTPFHGGDVWTPELAFAFACSETGHGEAFLRSEIDRYLGWPAQAISYKIGQREWVAARDEAKEREGAAFDLRAFHTKALRLGPVGLDQLRGELAR